MSEHEIANDTNLDITSPDQLQKLEGIVHDEYFELDDVDFQRDKSIVEIPYRRIFHDGPSKIISNRILYKVCEVDVVRAVLITHNVGEFSIQDSARIGTYSFNSISYDGHTVKIACDPSLELTIEVPHLLVQSRYLQERGKARITQGLFGELSDGKVYE